MGFQGRKGLRTVSFDSTPQGIQQRCRPRPASHDRTSGSQVSRWEAFAVPGELMKSAHPVPFCDKTHIRHPSRKNAQPPVVAWLTVVFGPRPCDNLSASDRRNGPIPASFLCQWRQLEPALAIAPTRLDVHFFAPFRPTRPKPAGPADTRNRLPPPGLQRSRPLHGFPHLSPLFTERLALCTWKVQTPASWHFSRSLRSPSIEKVDRRDQLRQLQSAGESGGLGAD